jgi:rod shape determining protein RodA
MTQYRTSRDMDWPLLLLTVVISSLGILQIYSATIGTVWRQAWWRQVIFVLAGLCVAYVVARIDYHAALEHVPILYALSLGALVVVLVLAKETFGARRWIPLPGGFTFQVSEFAKIVVILLIARYLSELKSERPDVRDMLKLGALVALPMALVMKQPDLGTALTYAAIAGGGIFFAGLRWQHAVAILLILLLILPVGWTLLKDYQKSRLTSFLDPGSDPLRSGYQVIQSMIAVGSGGMWGKGVTQGSQTQLRFLPVPHTDFILSSFAEEHGFVGVVVVLGLYCLMLLLIVRNAQVAPDRAGMYVCMSVGALLLFQLLVNVGMVVGRMPVTGLPLPLMSYGGSSVLTTFLMLGLVNNVRLQRFVN